MFGGRHLTCIKFVDGGVGLWVLETNENSVTVFNLIEGTSIELSLEFCVDHLVPHLVFEGI